MLVWNQIINHVIQKKNLTPKQIQYIFKQIKNNNFPDYHLSILLVGLMTKGITTKELTLFAEYLLDEASQFDVNSTFMDVCGTGGDYFFLFNVSTLTALVLSTYGVNILKHGNKNITSKVGSANALTTFNYQFEKDPQIIKEQLSSNNFAFLFAPYFHPVMKNIASIRSKLKVMTIFNLLGPLINPAKPKIQFMGISLKSYLDVIIQTAQNLQKECVIIFSSEEGLDEVSPILPTEYRLLHKGKILKGKIIPPEAIKIASLKNLRVYSESQSKKTNLSILRGEHQDGVNMLALNAATAFYIWDLYHNRVQKNIQDYINTKTLEIKGDLESGKVYKALQNKKIIL